MCEENNYKGYLLGAKLLALLITKKYPRLKGTSEDLFGIKDQRTLEGCLVKFLAYFRPEEIRISSLIDNPVVARLAPKFLPQTEIDVAYFNGMYISELLIDKIILPYIPELKKIAGPMKSAGRGAFSNTMQQIVAMRIYNTKYNIDKVLDFAIVHPELKKDSVEKCIQKVLSVRNAIQVQQWDTKIKLLSERYNIKLYPSFAPEKAFKLANYNLCTTKVIRSFSSLPENKVIKRVDSFNRVGPVAFLNVPKVIILTSPLKKLLCALVILICMILLYKIFKKYRKRKLSQV